MKRNLFYSLLVILMMVIVMSAVAGFSFASEISEFAPIEMLEARAVKSNTVALKWNSIPNATEYIVYGARCGRPLEKITTSKEENYKVKTIKGKKLKPHRLYKFRVVAKTQQGKVSSKNIHFITGNTFGKYANTNSIKATPTSQTLKVGKSLNIKTSIKVYRNKKHISVSHGKATRYISNNPIVAKVNGNGKIEAMSPGKATIYVQDICGVYDEVSITVNRVVYSPIEYRITLSLEGGDGEQIAYTVYGQRFRLTSLPTMMGHSFDGMFTEPVDGNRVISADGNPIPNVPGYTDASARWIRTQDTTLYAHWEANIYDVHFDSNGGTGGPVSAEAIFGQEFSVSEAPERTGYGFDGWFTASSDGEKIISADGNLAAWTRTEDTTLYAHWIPNTYQIQFNANSGTGEMEDLNMTYDVPKTLSANAFSKEGSVFIGWSKTASGATDFDNKSSVNNLTAEDGGTVNLYALWATKGDLIKIKGTDGTFVDQDGGNATANGNADVFRIVKVVSSDAIEVMAMNGPQMRFDQVDNYLSNTYAPKLENKIGQNAVIPQNITRGNYYYYTYNPGGTAYKGQNYWAKLTDSYNMGNKKVYALDVQDVFNYLGGNSMSLAQGSIMFFNSTSVNNSYCWLRSTCNYVSNLGWVTCGCNISAYYNLAAGYYNLPPPGQARASFALDLNAVAIRK